MPLRRLVVSVAISHLACFTACTPEPPPQRPAVQPAGAAPGYELDGLSEPVIYAGDTVTLSTPFESFEPFLPTFGAQRAVVNPTRPSAIDAHRLRFDRAGEYYLVLDGERHLKVLVLERGTSWSERVVRIFDFTVANSMFCDRDDRAWYDGGANAYLSRWFTSPGPAALLCGPTHELFRQLVAQRLGLPTRFVTFPGTYRHDGKIQRMTHNVAEVYLPDQGKFVMFDVNNGLLVEWLGAMEIAAVIRSRSASAGALNASSWADLGLKLYTAGPALRMPRDYTCGPTGEPGSVANADFQDRDWDRLLIDSYSRMLYGGVAHFARPSYGTEFLPHYTFASQHDDPELERSAVEWVNEWNIEVQVVSRPELTTMLDAGFAQVLAEKAWIRFE